MSMTDLPILTGELSHFDRIEGKCFLSRLSLIATVPGDESRRIESKTYTPPNVLLTTLVFVRLLLIRVDLGLRFTLLFVVDVMLTHRETFKRIRKADLPGLLKTK